MKYVRGSDGGEDQSASLSSLTCSQIRKLAETALQLENHFGQPQDIEWSFDHQGNLYILQSRPIHIGKKEPVPEYPTGARAK